MPLGRDLACSIIGYSVIVLITVADAWAFEFTRRGRISRAGASGPR
jgi:hypothetical protein